MTRRDRRARTTGRLGVAHGERYALLPREVVESDAYRALPPWAVVVLVALAAQYYGCRNGSLALPIAEAKRLGVRNQAQLYGGLQVLEATELVRCTRRGHLSGGKQLPTLYALTWRSIDEPATGVCYDAGISVTTKPPNDWARWARPADWKDRVLVISRRARGKRGHICPYTTRADSPRGEAAAHPMRSGQADFRSPRGESKPPNPAHPVVETSKTSGAGASATTRVES